MAAILVAGVLHAATALSADQSASSAPAGRGAIRGRVVAVDTGAAIPRATVSVRMQSGRESRTVTTDEQGRYEVRDLIPERYVVNAGKNGYLTLGFGQRRPLQAGRPIEVVPGKAVEGIDFMLPRGSVIVARVTNEFGEPLSGVRVDPERSTFANGQRTLARVPNGVPFQSSTDDRGEVRLYGLPPGDYYVLANGFGPSGQLQYGATYFPGTMSPAEASRISIGTGEEIPVTFALVPASAAARISGVLLGVNGTPFYGKNLMLWQRAPNGGSSARGVLVQPDGTFSLTNVAPGTYTLSLPDAGDGAVLEQPLAVPPGADLSGLVIRATPGGVMRGRIVFDGDSRERNPQSVPLTVESASGAPSSARMRRNDGATFEATGLTGLRLVRLPREDNGWFLKAVRYQGRDVTDVPFDFGGGTMEIEGVEVIVSLRGSGVSGAVVDGRGDPVTDCVVVVFPEDPERWTAFSRAIGVGSPDQKGTFLVRDLPPGEYRIVAVPDIEQGSERDPEVLERLRGRAERVTLTDAATSTISLRLAD